MVAYARGHVIRNSLFEIDGTDYSNQVNTVEFLPDTPVQTYRTLVPDGAITDTDSATWTLHLTGVQDFGTGSLGKKLRENAGLDMDVVYQPVVGVGQDHVEAVIRGVQLPVGGAQGSFRTFDITLGVIGEPDITQSV